MNFNFRSDEINLCIKIRVMHNLVRGRKASKFLASRRANLDNGCARSNLYRLGKPVIH